MRLPRILRVLAITGRKDTLAKMKNGQTERQSNESLRGYILVEILIAIALIGIVAVGVLSALSTSSKVLIISDERTTAESLARRQMEYVKNQGYNSTVSVLSEPVYVKISGIPEGYSVWSVNRAGAVVEDIVGIVWDSQNNRPAGKDNGLQKVAVVIKHKDEPNQDKVIYTFINSNPYWAYDVTITLEGYKIDR
jgi:type II secretory pathway pseudopilin PulG